MVAGELSNTMSYELAKELEARGHRFIRYVDDSTIAVRSEWEEGNANSNELDIEKVGLKGQPVPNLYHKTEGVEVPWQWLL